MTPPKTLTCLSDQNEMELTQIIKLKTGNLLEYKFIKSETKLGMLMTFTESGLEENLKNKIFK